MRFQPTTVTAVVERLADRLAQTRRGHPVRVAVDGSPHAGVELVAPLADALRFRGRPVVTVSAWDFLRPASLRLERGRDDPDGFYELWLDRPGLRREVLDPCGPGGSRRYLPSLWDAERDRATRAAYAEAPVDAVLLVRGELLLVDADAYDVAVHLDLSPAALRRRVPRPDAARVLPAYARYAAEVRPARIADVVVRCDDPRHPAVAERR